MCEKFYAIPDVPYDLHEMEQGKEDAYLDSRYQGRRLETVPIGWEVGRMPPLLKAYHENDDDSLVTLREYNPAQVEGAPLAGTPIRVERINMDHAPDLHHIIARKNRPDRDPYFLVRKHFAPTPAGFSPYTGYPQPPIDINPIGALEYMGLGSDEMASDLERDVGLSGGQHKIYQYRIKNTGSIINVGALSYPTHAYVSSKLILTDETHQMLISEHTNASEVTWALNEIEEVALVEQLIDSMEFEQTEAPEDLSKTLGWCELFMGYRKNYEMKLDPRFEETMQVPTFYDGIIDANVYLYTEAYKAF